MAHVVATRPSRSRDATVGQCLAKPFIRAFISVTDSRHDLQSLQLKNSFLETSYGNHPVVLSHTQHR